MWIRLKLVSSEGVSQQTPQILGFWKEVLRQIIHEVWCMHAYYCTNIYIYIYICIYGYVYIYIYRYTHIYIYTDNYIDYTQYIYIYIYICYTYTPHRQVPTLLAFVVHLVPIATFRYARAAPGAPRNHHLASMGVARVGTSNLGSWNGYWMAVKMRNIQKKH